MWQRTGGLVFSDWTDRFKTVLRKFSGPHVEISQNSLEMGEGVGGNWW